ncbi:hypothetical protein COU37_03490 [Candidatus Micrarchaeota archaeon CG10_big_fil_rev_8_21_14_0_10_45_29]|nr:MAG: hypothetical protein COU37_03490 [Candidatus Micrarchaeota archaeon CG10_big_fil_rev_8_21_14_0_10_45_29]
MKYANSNAISNNPGKITEAEHKKNVINMQRFCRRAGAAVLATSILLIGVGGYYTKKYNDKREDYENKLEKNLFFKKNMSYENQLAKLDSLQKNLHATAEFSKEMESMGHKPMIGEKEIEVQKKGIAKRKKEIEGDIEKNYEKNRENVEGASDAAMYEGICFSGAATGIAAMFASALLFVAGYWEKLPKKIRVWIRGEAENSGAKSINSAPIE